MQHSYKNEKEELANDRDKKSTFPYIELYMRRAAVVTARMATTTMYCNAIN